MIEEIATADTIPTVDAYSPSPLALKTMPQWLHRLIVPCPICGHLHTHHAAIDKPTCAHNECGKCDQIRESGPIEVSDRRAAHCQWYGRAHPEFYMLRFAGVLPDAIWKRWRKARRSKPKSGLLLLQTEILPEA